jgi:MFS-type transporter involved in bile tolerance (Atg22 family)
MTYRNFLVANRGILSFGILLTFSSSFGQTFLISLFVPYLLNEFSLSHAQFGNLYSAATLLAAAFLPVLGSWIDRTHLRDYSIAVAVGLAFSCLLVYLSTSVPVLFVALLALRLAGQGLLSHTPPPPWPVTSQLSGARPSAW